jgi:hypothetical protein
MRTNIQSQGWPVVRPQCGQAEALELSSPLQSGHIFSAIPLEPIQTTDIYQDSP